MKNYIRKASIGTTLLAFAMTGMPLLHAADSTKNKDTKAVVAAQNKAGQSSDDIIGQDVRSTTGQDLGEVQDLVINTADGRVVYALISTGGFLGIGDTIHAIPFSAFQSGQPVNHALTVDLHGKDWKAAPTVRQDQLAELAGNRRGSEIYSYYGRDWNTDMKSNGSKANSSESRLLRVSQITGKEVRNGSQKVGDVEEVIVNFEHQRATALLDPNDDYTGTDNKFAISFDQLTPSTTDKDVLTTTLTREKFQNVTPISNDWATMTTGYPYVWGYGLGMTAYPLSSDMNGRTPIAQVRRELRNDTTLGDTAKSIQVTRRNDQLVLRGHVRSEDLKNKIGDKAETLAKGWDVKNNLSVDSAAE